MMATTSFMVWLSFLSNSGGAPRIAPFQLWHLFTQMAQKVCSHSRKTIAVNYLRWIASSAGACIFHQNPISSPAVLWPPRPHQRPEGDNMADRSWFFASQGQQQGPVSEAQLRDLIATGKVTRETLVWTEGMANWQKAGDIPGLLAGGGPPATPQPGGLPVSGGYGDGSLSVDFGIWDFVWRGLVLFVSLMFVIPVPWALLMYCRWIVSCVRVPQRPNLAFTGRAVDLMWFYALVILFVAASWTQNQVLHLAVTISEFVLYWLLIKWFVANLSSDGQPLGLRFSGSFWGFLGWSLLAVLSVLTIIGWAWVYVAQIRWMCRHIEGTRRDVVFKGTGLEFLWRSIVTALLCVLVIPTPWIYRWFTRWLVSQVFLVPKATLAAV